MSEAAFIVIVTQPKKAFVRVRSVCRDQTLPRGSGRLDLGIFFSKEENVEEKCGYGGEEVTWSREEHKGKMCVKTLKSDVGMKTRILPHSSLQHGNKTHTVMKKCFSCSLG